MLKILNKNDWFVKFQLEFKIKRVKRLFFVHKFIKNVLCKNFEILIIDCTYKINKYKMSIFVIMKVIVLRINFYIDFAFLKKEEKLNFNWIIEQLKTLYVVLNLKNSVVIVIDRNSTLMKVIEINYFEIHNFFCVWHINKNVLKNCKSTFDTQKEWKKFLVV